MDIEAGFWCRDYKNDAELIPKVDQQRIVYVASEHILHSKERCFVFYYPPYAEFNGWDDSPSEISATQVIECSLAKLESYPFSDPQINEFVGKGIVPQSAVKYQAQIISVTPFLEFCKNYSHIENFAFVRCGHSDGSSTMIWEESREYRKAIYGGNLLYLSGSVSEQSFSTVIEINNDRYFVKFHYHYDPSQNQSVVVNYELKGEELLFFKKAIDNAVVLNA